MTEPIDQATKVMSNTQKKTYSVNLTQGELKALFDAAGQMSDDFEDYYSFMGPKRVKEHAKNYSNAMDKIRCKIKS